MDKYLSRELNSFNARLNMNGDNDALKQSLADIDHDLHSIFTQHPDSHINDAGDPVIPADALVDVFQSFADIYNGLQLLSSEEMDMLKALLASNPGLEVTPQILMDFIAEKTKHAPQDDNVIDQDTERPPEDPESDELNNGSHSRPSSRGGTTKYSPFDAERRQRSQPLAAPSSWSNKRPPPASRRKSIDLGSRSDSEVCSLCPIQPQHTLITLAASVFIVQQPKCIPPSIWPSIARSIESYITYIFIFWPFLTRRLSCTPIVFPESVFLSQRIIFSTIFSQLSPFPFFLTTNHWIVSISLTFIIPHGRIILPEWPKHA